MLTPFRCNSGDSSEDTGSTHENCDVILITKIFLKIRLVGSPLTSFCYELAVFEAKHPLRIL